MADDVRVVGAFLRLEEHRNVPPRRDIEAALSGWWCIAVDRAVPDGDGVPIVAIVRRKAVHALKNLKEGSSSSSCQSNRRRTQITRTKKERNPTPPPPSRYSYSLLVSSSSSSNRKGRRFIRLQSSALLLVKVQGQTHTCGGFEDSRLENFCLLFFSLSFFLSTFETGTQDTSSR